MIRWSPKREFDFSKYEMIQLIDGNTPEDLVWKNLKAYKNEVIGKRLTIDPHIDGCLIAILVLSDCDYDFITSRLYGICSAKNYKLRGISDWLDHVAMAEEIYSRLHPDRNMQRKVIIGGLKDKNYSDLQKKFEIVGNVFGIEDCDRPGRSTDLSAELTMGCLSEALAAEYVFNGAKVNGMLLEVKTKDEPIDVLLQLHKHIPCCMFCYLMFKHNNKAIRFKTTNQTN